MWEYAATGHSGKYNPEATRISKPGIWPHRHYDPNAKIGLMKEQLKRHERENKYSELAYQIRLFVEVGVGSDIRRLIAEVAAELAALKLGTTIPTVNFVPRSHPEAPGRMGWCGSEKNEIFVVDGFCFCQTADTAAHEVKHLEQYKNGDQVRFSKERNENCASYYGLAFQREHATVCAGCQ